jgi:alpha-N-arabinofuranosidase
MAVNTKDAPETIKPAPLEGVEIWGEQVRAKLAPASWNVIRLDVQKQ